MLTVPATDALRMAFESRDTGQMLAAVTSLSDEFVSVAANQTLRISEVDIWIGRDRSLVAHSFRVAIYATLLARDLGIQDDRALKSLAAAAMLHDVGKLRLPARVLNKTKALSDIEQRLMSQHPQYGFERLCAREDVSFEQLMVVYQHHEQPDGRGYPVGSSSHEIHDWAKITAVANAFDGLLTRSTDETIAASAAACTQINALAGTVLDQEMVRCWTHAWSA